MPKALKILSAATAASIAVRPALAQPLTVAADSGDTGWVMISAVLGLSGVLAGLVGRTGDRIGAILGAAALTALFWAVLGYSLAFGGGSSLIGGVDHVFLGSMADIREGATIPDMAFALLHLGFALAAVGLLIASVADRARLSWALLFAPLWLLFAYVPNVHWIWGNGWLTSLGALDYAGGIAVHLSAGVSALVLALMLGRRKSIAEPAAAAPAAGVPLLVGWLALAGGAGLGATSDASSAILYTVLAASVAALGWAGFAALRGKPVSVHDILGGGLSGVAAIAPSAGYTGAAGAILLGIVGGVAGYALSRVVAKRKVDDPLAVFASSGVGGALGAVLLPVAMLPLLGAPLFEDAAPFIQQLVAQGVAVASIGLWSVIATLIAGYTASMAFPIRRED